MPDSSNNYIAICGPLPHPESEELLPYVDTYIAKRVALCFKKRTGGTYYIDPVSGLDANNGTSPATPWKTLTNVRTLLAANVTNRSFLLKRGTILLDYTGLINDANDNYFGPYGAVTAEMPIISHFTVNLASSVVTWTLAETGRYTTSMPSVGVNNPSGAVKPGWIRKVNERYNPLKYVDSAAKVAATPYSFWIDGSNLIHMNPGNDTISATDYEAVPHSATAPNGILFTTNAHGSMIHNLITEGWGCMPQYAGGCGNSGITISGGANATTLVLGCKSKYQGRHGISQLGTGATGGIHVAIDCEVWGCCSVGGYSSFNSYTDNGSQETVFLRCTETASCLPIDAATATPSNVPFGSVVVGGQFYGHTGGTNKTTGLYINKDCGIGDERAINNRVTTSVESWNFNNTTTEGFIVGTENDPSTYRLFIIGFKSPRTQIDAVSNNQFQSYSRMVFINGRHSLRLNYANAKFWVAGSNALYINCIFELEVMPTSQVTQFFTQNALQTICPRFLNCLFLVTGGGASGVYCYLGGQNSSGMLFGNCVAVSWSRCTDPTYGIQLRLGTSGNQAGAPSAQNDTAHLRYIAVAGVLLNDSGNDRGFSNALGLVNLETANKDYPVLAALSSKDTYTISTDSSLYAAGHPDPFADVGATKGMPPAPKYDMLGRPRPAVPSLGPIDVYTAAAGGGGGIASDGLFQNLFV